jgi:SAM-dependent methyltransferase
MINTTQANIKSTIENATSVTHEHFLYLISSEITKRLKGKNNFGQTIRILDAGCGNGLLIAYLYRNLPKINPDFSFDLHGFDVTDSQVQKSDFFDTTIKILQTHIPTVEWESKLSIIQGNQIWPYQRDSFDFVISNQVLEHVVDHELFFSNTYRVLKPSGFSAHLFPLKSCIYEGHLDLPFAHKIHNYDILVNYIKTCSKFGLGKFQGHHQQTGISLNDFSMNHADYMYFFTNYLSYQDILALGKKYRLRVSTRYTHNFYTTKIRNIIGFKKPYTYTSSLNLFSALLESLMFLILKRIASITICLEKEQTYGQ